MLLKKCKYAGCNELVSNDSYCRIHRPVINKIIEQNKREKEKKPFAGCANPNRNLYNTRRWRKLRMEWLKDNPYCVFCGSTADLTVDHIERPKGNPHLFFSFYNLRTLCKTCHYRHTGYENRRRKDAGTTRKQN